MDAIYATVIGRLGTEPARRTLPSGAEVVSFRVASSYRTATGEGTTWLSVSAFGRSGEFAIQYLSKGRKIIANGTLRTREWTGRDGAKHLEFELTASNIIAGDSQTGQSNDARDAYEGDDDEDEMKGISDEIPF